MVIQLKSGATAGFAFMLSSLEMTRNKVHTVPNFWVAVKKLQGVEEAICSVCVVLTQRQEAEKIIKFPILKAWANTVQDVLV